MTNSLMLRKPDVFKVGVSGGPVVDWKWYEIIRNLNKSYEN